jgi:hypothetical protein
MTRPLNVVELFAGLKGWSQPFTDRGHNVWTTDIDPRFDTDATVDIRDLDTSAIPFDTIDVLLASPPCESFSVASIGHHWTGGHRAYEPKTDAARLGMDLVLSTMALRANLAAEGRAPEAMVVENPRGVLRNLKLIRDRRGAVVDPTTVWYCHYGDTRAKPTDLWLVPGPRLWRPRPPCHNRRADHADTCCCRDHEAAPRGAKTGTQGIRGYAERSVIPYGLAFSVCQAAERNEYLKEVRA